jgi:hypothetical protein
MSNKEFSQRVRSAIDGRPWCGGLATLPDELIKKIGNIFLSKDDLDYYAVYRQSAAAGATP